MRIQGGYIRDTVRVQWGYSEGTLGHSEGSVGVQWDTVRVQGGYSESTVGYSKDTVRVYWGTVRVQLGYSGIQ